MITFKSEVVDKKSFGRDEGYSSATRKLSFRKK
jgi:hypothetical protein